MSRRQEFDIPDLGPADGGRPGATSPRMGASGGPPRRVPPAPARGNNLLHSLVLILLTAAASGLGYWGYGLQQQLESSVELQQEVSRRLADLEQLLEVASDSASQSGQSMSGRLEQQSKMAAEKYRFFDSEIAKLWTIAYQSNKPRIDAQEKQLAAQDGQLTTQAGDLSAQAGQLSTQAAQLAAQAGQMEAQSSQLAQLGELIKTQGAQLETRGVEIKSLQTRLAAYGETLAGVEKQLDSLAGLEGGLEQGQAGLKADLESALADVKRALATLDTQVRISEEIQSDKVAAQQTEMRKLHDKISVLEGNAVSPDLGRRLRVNEQAIQAIDGNRRQLNQDVLQLRQQLNNLQLRLK